GQFLTGWNARFYIKGVPAFYFPYVSVPVQRKRQSGFLQPKIGYSELRGTAVENSFFWAISENTDATFYLDVETNRGVGEGVEYRYIRTRKSYGELSLYHFGEKDMERVRSFREDVDNLSRPANASDTRFQLKLDHTEIFSNGIKLRASLNFVSDDEFLLDFAGRSERSLESIENNISLSRNWSTYSLVAQLRYFNNILDDKDRTTLQKLPEITFAGSDRKIFNTPFYISSESSLINFTRKEGVTGQRLDVKPRVSLPMSPGGIIDIKPSIAPRATLYLLDGDPRGSYAERYLYEIDVDAATTFVRVFRPGLESVDAFRHTIRPRLTYTYIPQVDQDDLPQFDAVDNVAEQNTLAYSLVSALTGKAVKGDAAHYRDYAYFDLRQSYDIKEATRRLTAPGDRRRPFSDIRAELMLSPSEKVRLTALGEYDVYESWFNSYNASLAARDGRGDSINLAYRFVREEATRYLEASARLRVTRPLDLTYLKRFSFDENRSLETSYGMEYRRQCWGSTLTYSERLEERIVFLTFDLSGLGRVAGVEGKLEPL
ncbi:MAG: LPS assembly protein LptD, partial [Deltaproteobacteria bacterium]|nr:LPS assembly protein LptD [Deltaproteobacteria bacterium]